MLDPLADIRKNFMLQEHSAQRLIKEAALGTSIREQFKDFFDGVSGIGSAAKMWAQQMEEARAQARGVIK
ncbi:hypothetical protein E4T70_09205, partial [Lactobacillus johnsonii]